MMAVRFYCCALGEYTDLIKDNVQGEIYDLFKYLEKVKITETSMEIDGESTPFLNEAATVFTLSEYIMEIKTKIKTMKPKNTRVENTELYKLAEEMRVFIKVLFF